MNKKAKAISTAILVFLILPFSGSSQFLDEIDSLKHELTREIEPESRFTIYMNLASEYRDLYSDADSSLIYTGKALQLSHDLNNDSLRFWVLAYQANIERLKAMDDFGKQEVGEIIPHAINKKDTALLLFSLYEKMVYHLKRDELEESIKVARKSIGYAEAVADSSRLAEAYVVLGLVSKKRQAYDAAFDYLDKASEVACGDYKSFVTGNQANVLLDQGDLEGALIYARKSLAVISKTGRLNQLSTLYGDIGTIYLKLEEYDSAEFYSSKALETQKKTGNLEGVSDAAFNMARIYEQKGNYEKCREYAQLSVDTSTKIASISKQACFNKYISRIHKRQGNYQQAYENLEKATELKEFLYNQKRIESINELEVKYLTKQKEAENELLKMDQRLQNAIIDRQRGLLVAALVLGAGAVVFIFFISRLSQKRKRDSSRIQEQKDRLEAQSQKLKQIDASKSRFFANISHDFKTPLTLIYGCFHTITREDNFLTEKSRRSIETGMRNLNQLNLFTDEIRDLTLLEYHKLQLKFEPVHIHQLISVNAEMFSSMAEIQNIELSFESTIQSNTIINADPFNLEKVIQNLISNALRYTNEGGVVKIKLSGVGEDGVLVGVIDDGPGIQTEDLPHIFDRFYQSSKNDYQAREGLGIGLALVKELVELHGGEVQVKSKPGKGTVFSFFLPFNLDKQLDSDSNASYSSKLQSESIKSPDATIGSIVNSGRSKWEHVILIVEDHPEVLDYISSSVSPDYTILTAKNGTEALDVLNSQKVDLIITDLMMPFMDGFELIEFIKSRDDLKHIEIMVLSARNTQDDKQRILSQGINEFLSKPFNPAELNQRIANLVNRSKPDTFRELATDKGYLSDIEQNLVGKLNNYILSRIDDPQLGVENLADLLHTSERNVHRIIKQLTEHSPKAYIRKIRIDYAESLLKSRKVKSVKAACKAVGLSNATSFAAQFEKQKGIAPSELLPKQGQ